METPNVDLSGALDYTDDDLDTASTNTVGVSAGLHNQMYMDAQGRAAGLEREKLRAEVEAALAAPIRLTTSLVAERHKPQIDAGRDLFSLYHLHLDGLELEIVDDLDCFTRATHIYLQRNRIRIVNTIDDLARLRLLCLADNCIDDISDMGLASLHSLVCLDLSRNKLKQLDTDDLPPYLISLDLRGNPCIAIPGYRHTLLAELPYLTKLDGTEVTREERMALGLPVEDEEEEDDTLYTGHGRTGAGASAGVGADALSAAVQRLSLQTQRELGFTKHGDGGDGEHAIDNDVDLNAEGNLTSKQANRSHNKENTNNNIDVANALVHTTVSKLKDQSKSTHSHDHGQDNGDDKNKRTDNDNDNDNNDDKHTDDGTDNDRKRVPVTMEQAMLRMKTLKNSMITRAEQRKSQISTEYEQLSRTFHKESRAFEEKMNRVKTQTNPNNTYSSSEIEL